MQTQMYGGPMDGYAYPAPTPARPETRIYWPYLDKRTRGRVPATDPSDPALEPLVRYCSVYEWDADGKRYRYVKDERC